MPTRADVVAYARSLDGLSASPHDPESLARYLELVAPVEPAALAADMARMSGCALVMRGILRRFISHEILERPYRIGHATSDLVEIARRAVGLHGREPEHGDLVIVGGGFAGGGPEHVWMALTEPYDESELDGLDGGQFDAGGHQRIVVRRHEIVDGWDHAGPTAHGSAYVRRVRYVLDLEAILEVFGRA